MDQLEIKSESPDPPERIISLVPSLTELLYDLGMKKEVVGITRYCPLPEDKRWRPSVIGGTKDFNFNQIDALSPDLIIGSREENYQEGVIRLREKYPVWLCDILTLEDALKTINEIGNIIARNENAERLVQEIASEFSKLPAYPPLKVTYLIWQNPYMVAGGGTFINDILKRSGFVNIFQELPRYPVIAMTDLSTADAILLSSEPYPFTENEVLLMKNINNRSKVMLVDGEMFSWYGSHLSYTPAYLRQLRDNLQQMA